VDCETPQSRRQGHTTKVQYRINVSVLISV